jgi:hypothetical protein
VTATEAFEQAIEASHRAMDERVGDIAEITPVAVRVTSVFCLEDGDWKLLHRHADPITTRREARSVVQA